MTGWLMIGTFIAGVLVCVGQPVGAILMILWGTFCFAPLMNLLDQQSDDDEPEDDEDDDTGGSDRNTPGGPWWPDGVLSPDDDLVGV